MGGSCGCKNSSKIINYIKKIIERCIQKYMTFEETVTYLQENHQISHYLTKRIWEQLQRDNLEFFNRYNKSCIFSHQIKKLNEMFAMQIDLMADGGHNNTRDPSLPIMGIVNQPSRRLGLMENLATSAALKTKVTSPSLALLDTNGRTVMQLQSPNDQQNQLYQYPLSTSNDQQNQLYQYPLSTSNDPQNNLYHYPLSISNDQQNQLYHNPLSTSNDQQNQLYHNPLSTSSYELVDNYIGAPTFAPGATHQWCRSNDELADNCLGAPNVAPGATNHWCRSNHDLADFGAPIVAQTTTDQSTTTTDLDYIRAQTVAEADTTPENFTTCDIDFLQKILMESDEEPLDSPGQHQLQLQIQPYLSLEEQQPLQHVSSNELQHVNSNELQHVNSNELQHVSSNELQYEDIDQLLYNGFWPNQSMPTFRSVNQQEERVVIQHHHRERQELRTLQVQEESLNQRPEPDALNNPDRGDGPLTVDQNHCEPQWRKQRRVL